LTACRADAGLIDRYPRQWSAAHAQLPDLLISKNAARDGFDWPAEPTA